MSNFLNTIEKLSHKIPGYGGYVDREKSRDTDKKLREFMSQKIVDIRRKIDDLKSDMLGQGIIDYLSQLDNVASILDRLSNSVLYATRGYGSLFGINKVYEEDLEKLHNFDLNFMESVENLETSLDNVWNTEEKEFPAKIREMRSIVTRVESEWKNRQNVINSFQ